MLIFAEKTMDNKINIIKDWFIMSVATLILTYMIWLLMYGIVDFKEIVEEGVVFDAIYCSVYSLYSLSISNYIGSLFGKNNFSKKRFILHIFLIFIANICYAFILENVLKDYWNEGNDDYWDRLYISGILATLMTMVNACKYYYSIIIQKDKENMDLYSNLLRLQMNPHFIFNSLNTLADLIQVNPARAEKYTLRLSEIYRYIVNHLDDNAITICEEIYFVRTYCELQELRMPDTVIAQIEEKLDESKDLILPLTVQMLVENAIKHNCHTKEKPLLISIFRQQGYLVVRNELKPIKSSFPTTQKGLQNLVKRYKQIGKELVVSNNDSFFEVKIPIL